MAKRKTRTRHATRSLRRRKIRTRVRRASKVRVRVKTVFVPALEGLLGSVSRAKTLRMLYRHTGTSFSESQIADMLMLPKASVHRELTTLAVSGIVRARTGGKFKRFQVNHAFPFFEELRAITLLSHAVPSSVLIDALSGAMRPKLVVTSGVFMNIPSSSIDLFVVGEGYSEKKLARAMRRIEAQLGTELRWTGMTPKEFVYRWKMFDRFVRAIFEGPHEVALGKIPKG